MLFRKVPPVLRADLIDDCKNSSETILLKIFFISMSAAYRYSLLSPTIQSNNVVAKQSGH